MVVSDGPEFLSRSLSLSTLYNVVLLASASCPPSSLEQSQIYVGRDNFNSELFQSVWFFTMACKVCGFFIWF